MRRFGSVCAVSIAVLAISTVGPAAEPDFQPGQWETRMEISMEGLPIAIPPQVQTVTTCLTREKAAPDTGDGSSDCKMTEQKFEGNKVTWKVTCTSSQGITEGSGEITYTGATYTGTFTMNMAMGGQTMRTVTKMQGKRLGDCPH